MINGKEISHKTTINANIGHVFWYFWVKIKGKSNDCITFAPHL